MNYLKYKNWYSETTGAYNCCIEKALKIEIIASEKQTKKIKELCKAIKEVNKQKAVLLTVEQVKALYLWKGGFEHGL